MLSVEMVFKMQIVSLITSCNPPYGVSWKKMRSLLKTNQDPTEDFLLEHKSIRWTTLFLQHMISKWNQLVLVLEKFLMDHLYLGDSEVAKVKLEDGLLKMTG